MRTLSFSTDKAYRIRSWGKTLSEFTGRPAGETIGRKYFDILPRILLKSRDALAVAARSKRPVVLREYRFRCFYTNISSDISIVPGKDADGAVSKLAVSIRPRSACPLAEKLDQSQRLIDIGKVASTLAHGVRNPLNAIKGAVVYLGEKYSTEQPLAEFTQIMSEEISRLENFISRFLSSSVSATEAAPMDVNHLLKKIEVFTSLQAYAHNVTAVYDLGAVPMLTVNAFHLEQAVLNVVNNAIEAMDRGGRLTVRTLTETRDGALNVVIEVSDTGRGMKESKPRDIETAAKTGKGFGLYLTYEILRYYGGHLEISSGKQSGTTVRLRLPVENPARGMHA